MFASISIYQSGLQILSVVSYDYHSYALASFDFSYAHAESCVHKHTRVCIMCLRGEGVQKYRDTLIIIFSLDMLNFEVPSTCF